MKQDRIKSKVVWVAVLAQIVLILNFVLTPEQISAIQVIVMAVIECFTIFGILNDPTNKNGF